MAIRPPDDRDKPKQQPPVQQKPVPRKPGQVVDRPGDQQEEHVAEAEVRLPQQVAREAETQEAQQRSKDQKKRQGGGGGGGQPETMKAGELLQPGRLDVARSKGFSQGPSIGDFVAGQSAPKAGTSFAEMLPGSRVQRADLPEPTMRPPVFLSVFEGMRDIYLRSRGRASPKTRELLEGPLLEDLVRMLLALQEDEKLARSAEAKLNRLVLAKLGADPGPLLTGLADPRLSEPWRLFLDGWDLWVTDGEGDGVELFWEGEAEDDDGEAIEILQALRLKDGELTLEAKIGTAADRVTFDGQAFYRLKSDR